MLTDQMTGVVGIMVAVQAVVAVGAYVWTSLALMAVFRKAGEAPWKAWVPVLNSWTLFELGGMRGWWSVVIAGGAVVVGSAALALGGALGAAALDASFGGDAAGAQALVVAAATVPALLWLVVLIPALVLHIRMLLGVGRGFGVGPAFAVLGVILFPVWASVLGWGSARWLRAQPESAAPPVELTPAPPIVPALADFSARPAAAPAFGGTPVFGTGPAAPAPGAAAAPGFSPAPQRTPASPAGPAPAFGAPRAAANPWAPPAAAAPRVEVQRPAPATAPAMPAAAGPSAPDAIDERTVLAGRRHPTAALLLPGGATVALAGDAAVLGRNPVAPATAPGAQVVAIDDVTRTVSKTHALLTRTAAGWVVTDLESTNGVFVGPTADTATEVTGSAPVDGPFFLGDAALSIRADG